MHSNLKIPHMYLPESKTLRKVFLILKGLFELCCFFSFFKQKVTKNTTMISAETENTPTMTSFPLVLLTVGSSPVLKIKSENRSSSKHSIRWKTYHIVWRASRLITTKSYGLILDLWQHQFAIRFAVTFAINALFIWVTPRSILNITFAKKGTFIWICKKTIFTPLEVMNLYTHVNALLWSWE